jgi:hypothetical protein
MRTQKRTNINPSPPAGRNERLGPTESFPDLADWKFNKLPFAKWNEEYSALKDKQARGKLKDPFEKYLHDTYFPRREQLSKKKAPKPAAPKKSPPPPPPRKNGKRSAAKAVIQISLDSDSTTHIINVTFIIFHFLTHFWCCRSFQTGLAIPRSSSTELGS